MNNLIPQYLNEDQQRITFAEVAKNFSAGIITYDQLTMLVELLTRRARCILWCYLLKKDPVKTARWYKSSDHTMKLIMESMFANRVISPNRIIKEADKAFYKVKCDNTHWLIYDLCPSIF